MINQSSKKKKVWLWIDPTRKCNLSCELCYTKESHSKSDLSIYNAEIIFKKIANDNNIDIQILHLNWRGEPFMNKNLIQILQLASHYLNVPIHLHTNGMLLTKKICDEICAIDGNIFFFVSIDGGNMNTHDSNRGQGSFQKSILGLENLLEARSGNFPNVGIYQLNFKVHESEFDPKLKELIKKVDKHVIVEPIYSTSKKVAEFGGDDSVELHRNIELHRYMKSIPNGPCFWAGNALCIDPVGDVSVCLVSHDNEGVIGNILEEQLSDIITNADEFREKIIKLGRQSISHCKNCCKQEFNN